MKIKVDETRCTGCAQCVEVCPVDAVTVDGTAKIDEKSCALCGACIAACPSEALAMEGMETGLTARAADTPDFERTGGALPERQFAESALARDNPDMKIQENDGGLLKRIFNMFAGRARRPGSQRAGSGRRIAGNPGGGRAGRGGRRRRHGRRGR